jgi:predicted lipoprotein with Yx(FWY)xxD motif
MLERMIRRVGLLGASAALFAACAGGGSPTTAPATTTPGTQAPPAATTAPGSQAAAGLTLALATNATLGQYVTGANGMTLYIFTKDSGGTSACSGQCADNWPALNVTALSDVTAGAGVTGTLGTITGTDGKLQVTLGGHPLYYFKADAAAGDVNGQGVNGVWFAAGADGNGLGMGGGNATPAASKGCSGGPACD